MQFLNFHASSRKHLAWVFSNFNVEVKSFIIAGLSPIKAVIEFFTRVLVTLVFYRLSQYVFIRHQVLSLMAQIVKNLSAMQETQVQSPAREDPLEKGMETHSSNLAWEIIWTDEPGRLYRWSHRRVRHDLVTKQQQLS